MTGFVLIFLAAFLIICNYIIFQAIGGKILGAKIDEIGLFLSPSIFKFKLFGINFSLNSIPLGAYVKFSDEFEQLQPIRKILIVLIGLFSYFLLAVVFIGFSETIQKTLTLFPQIVRGAWSPIQVGAKYISDLANLMMTNSFFIGLGILAAKMLGSNLIPLGVLSGGSLMLYFFELLGYKSEKFNERFILIGLLVWLPFVVAWVVSISVFFLRSLRIV